MAKPKNLIDSFMEGLMQEAKDAVDSVTMETPKKHPSALPQNKIDQDHISIGSGSYQYQNNIKTGSGQDHIKIIKGSDKDQIHIRSVSDKYQVKVSPKDQDGSTNPEKQKSITKGSPSASLSKSHTMVFLWFKERGETGLFNKPEIERSLSMPYITIRKAIRKLESTGLIELNYDTCQKIYEYKLNPEKGVKLAKHISIGSGSYQDQNSIGSGSLISSSSLLNKTTTMQNCESDVEKIISQIMSTDAEYQYWIEQQVGPRQVAAWKKEFGLDLQIIFNNLCYARWQILNQKSEINKSAANYIYGIMKKNGGTVNKPAGYKSMGEQDLEFYENWKKQRQDHQQQIEQIKADALKAEIEPKIATILEAPTLENKYIRAALEQIQGKGRKQAIEITLSTGKDLDEKEKMVLRGYLEKIMYEEIEKKSVV